jgi:hypothetical protein
MDNNPPPSMAGIEGFPRDAALTGSRYAETAHGESRQLAQRFVIPARTGKAFPLTAGNASWQKPSRGRRLYRSTSESGSGRVDDLPDRGFLCR